MSTLKAKVKIDLERKLGKIDPNIYGQLMARRKWVVPEALYQPAHPDAGEDGLRKKVVEEIKRVKPSMIRWPGGCTGTSYQWKDGVGPKEKRQNTIDIHFGYDTDNGFGTAEFVDFCRQIGAEPHINLSTGYGTMQEAMEWIEYCNYTGNSKYANLRREHGYPEPFNIKYWQIGNENYGPWEINSASAHDYAIVAREWSKAIKKMDKNNKVLAVGGTAFKAATNWDTEVLTEAWNNIDYITGHRYWSFNTASGMHNYDQLAAVGCFEERTMKAMGGLIDLIARDKGSAIKPRLAFTEWNANGLMKEMSPEWRPGTAQYRMVDILAVAGFINAMHRNCDLVGLASFAQTINVVGMLVVTDEAIVRETIYWALYLSRLYSGNVSLDAFVTCDDGYSTKVENHGVDQEILNVPYLDVSITLCEESNKLYISLLNRHIDQELSVDLQTYQKLPSGKMILHTLWHEDPFAINTCDNPDKVVPKQQEVDLSGSQFELVLPPHSFTIAEIQL